MKNLVPNIFPSPQEMLIRPERLALQNQEGLIAWTSPVSMGDAAITMARSHGLRLTHAPGPEGRTAFACGQPPVLPRDRLPYVRKDGYLLRATPHGLSAEANAEAGLTHALDTLCQLIDENGSLPCVEIVDWPTCPHRGVMIDLARVVERPDYVISLLPFLAQCRINQLYLYLENKLALRCAPELAHPCAWTADEARKVVEAAKPWHIDVIPMLATLGHMESILKHPAYAHLAEPHTADHLAIHRPEARKFLAQVVEEVCSLFPSRFVHLGGDECPYLGRSLSGADCAPERAMVESYALGMNFLRGLLHERGRRGVLWADMVLQHPDLAPQLSRDLILIHWHYGPAHTQETDAPERLARQGFEVGVAPAILADEPFLPTVERLETNIPYLGRRTGLWGTIACLWEPRTQTLPVARIGMAIAGACAWNPFGHDPGALLKRASIRVYRRDISAFYRPLADDTFIRKMIESRMGSYHAFDLACSHPLALICEGDDPDWDALAERLAGGLRELERWGDLAREHPLDYDAFGACGRLAFYLARRQSLMRQGGRLSRNPETLPEDWRRYARELRETGDQALKALTLQTKAWNATRRHDDENFGGWFTQPLTFQRECLSDMAEWIETAIDRGLPVELGGRCFLRLQIVKGASPSWNLLRLRIGFSWDGQEWMQVFFRTVPLWMDKGVALSLMPRGALPQHIRIEPSCWCWHESKEDWSDMIQWQLVRLPLISECPPVVVSSPDAEYQLESSSSHELRLKLIALARD